MSCTKASVAAELPAGFDREEVALDAIQLLEVANFNGICRVIAALSQNGLISAEQIQNIYDCMTAPLDDPDWRDDTFVSGTRDVLGTVLAHAMKDARSDDGLALEEDR